MELASLMYNFVEDEFAEVPNIIQGIEGYCNKKNLK
jgi:hypothetical protein